MRHGGKSGEAALKWGVKADRFPGRGLSRHVHAFMVCQIKL